MSFREKVLKTAKATVDSICCEIANWEEAMVFSQVPWQEADRQIRLLQKERDKTLRFIARVEASVTDGSIRRLKRQMG